MTSVRPAPTASSPPDAGAPHPAPGPSPRAAAALGARQQAPVSERRAVVAGGLIVLVAGSLALRVEGIGMWYWLDEGLTVGLASRSVLEIPSLLRMDGSPPLYYWLLHGWMRVFGTGETATHALSLVFALATVPAGWWAGRSLFGPRAGWLAAALAATSPFLTHFARETRMYTLVSLLALVVAATFVHAFVFDRPQYAWRFGVSLTLLVYTHAWGLYTALAAVLALVPASMVIRHRRALWRRAAVTFGGVAVAFLPWALVFLAQATTTGAPWSHTPTPRQLVGELAAIVRDERVLVALLVAGVGGLLPLLRRPATKEQGAAWALVLLSAVPVGVGWLVAHIEPSWATRYLAVVVGPLLLLAGWGMARTGAMGLLAVAIAALLWVQPLTRLEGNIVVPPEEKSNAKQLAALLEPVLQADDLVIVGQPEAVPLFAHYLPRGLRFADTRGSVADAAVMDWRHALDDLAASTVGDDLGPLIAQLPPGSRVVMITPTTPPARTDTAWIRLFHAKSRAWRHVLLSNPALDRVATVRPVTEHRPQTSYIATVFSVR